jgi:hypothetical protein
VYFIGVFLIDLVLDFISAQLVKLMRRDLDKIRDGCLNRSISRRNQRPPQQDNTYENEHHEISGINL